jgi:hypothetical protein
MQSVMEATRQFISEIKPDKLEFCSSGKARTNAPNTRSLSANGDRFLLSEKFLFLTVFKRFLTLIFENMQETKPCFLRIIL